MRYYQCIFFDPWECRRDAFTLLGDENDWLINTTKCKNVEELKEALKKGYPADVLFLSSFFNVDLDGENENADREAALSFLETCGDTARPQLILFHGACDREGVIPRLRRAGYLVVHQNFNERHGTEEWKEHFASGWQE